jgi:hypothetical protein
MKRLMHPKHGWHMANAQEEHTMRKIGWVDDDGEAYRLKFNGAPPVGGCGSPPVVDATPVGAPPSTVEEARKRLDDLGIAYDGRWGLQRLIALL